MDQNLVVDILQAEIQVGRKVKQNQDNLKQFSEFDPEHAFETLKKLNLNSTNLNSSQFNVPGVSYKGLVEVEKLAVLYSQYDEIVSTVEIQAILSRHSAVSDKGMDYDCFMKFIGFKLGDTKRKFQIYETQVNTEKPLSERCMKALSSLFLLELDLLRFTEVHKVSLINNYAFDSTNFFIQLDRKNQYQIDFEILQSFFRKNSQEISYQDYQILLTRLKRNKLFDNQFITRQEFILLINPQLPYRGKNLQQSQVGYQISEDISGNQQFGQDKSQAYVQNDVQFTRSRIQNSSIGVQGYSEDHNIQQNSHNVQGHHIQQNHINTQGHHIQLNHANAQGHHIQQNHTNFQGHHIQQNHANVQGHHIQQNLTDVQGQNFQQNPPNFQTPHYIQGPQFVQSPPIVQVTPFIQGPPIMQGPPIYVQSHPYVQIPPSFAQNPPAVPYYSTSPPFSYLIDQPTHFNHPAPGYVLVQPPYQQINVNPPQQQKQQIPLVKQEPVEEKFLYEKHPNIVLEAMNDLLRKENDRLKTDNEEMMLKMSEFEKIKRLMSIEEQKVKKEQEEIKKQEEEKRKKEQERQQLLLKQQHQQKQQQQQQQQQQVQQNTRLSQVQSVVKLPVTHSSNGFQPIQTVTHRVIPQQSSTTQLVSSPFQSQLILSPYMSIIQKAPVPQN